MIGFFVKWRKFGDIAPKSHGLVMYDYMNDRFLTMLMPFNWVAHCIVIFWCVLRFGNRWSCAKIEKWRRGE